ncbi:MAG TPA: DUF6364 family protein [Syntrophales bacterium]|nr:DUF6364 family protein [Syntrophales bacterium]
MANITLSLDDELIKAGREYARKNHGTSLTNLIRKLLRDTVTPSSGQWVNECFALMDKARGRSGGKSLSREDLSRE